MKIDDILDVLDERSTERLVDNSFRRRVGFERGNLLLQSCHVILQAPFEVGPFLAISLYSLPDLLADATVKLADSPGQLGGPTALIYRLH